MCHATIVCHENFKLSCIKIIIMNRSIETLISNISCYVIYFEIRFNVINLFALLGNLFFCLYVALSKNMQGNHNSIRQAVNIDPEFY